MNTNQQYRRHITIARELFIKKTRDYSTSWRLLRTVSVVDQIFIKASRIKNIQDKKEQKVKDDIQSEFIGILNYGIIGLIQLKKGNTAAEELDEAAAIALYDEQSTVAEEVMLNKNHDYGEAWRQMSQQSFVDLILVKLMRIKQILSNEGKTLVSEGIDANFIDIINYAVFALILIEEGKHEQ